jgi:hypothetical protein
MDPMLRALANKVVLAAQLLPDIFNKNDVLKQTRVLLQVQIQTLHGAAGEILSGLHRSARGGVVGTASSSNPAQEVAAIQEDAAGSDGTAPVVPDQRWH